MTMGLSLESFPQNQLRANESFLQNQLRANESFLQNQLRANESFPQNQLRANESFPQNQLRANVCISFIYAINEKKNIININSLILHYYFINMAIFIMEEFD